MWWIKKQKLPNGALEDYRTDEEVKKDYMTDEVMMSSPLVWKTYEEWLKSDEAAWMKLIQVHNQDGSSSCVANACAYVAAINNTIEERTYIKMSPRWIYPYRMNRPSEGMHFNDAAQLLINRGSILHGLVPSDNMTEEQMQNAPEDQIPSFKTIATIYAPTEYFWVYLNIDSFAEVLKENKPILMGVRFANGEWNKDVPEILTDKTNYAHAICAIPKAYFMYKGKKAIMIVDSWGVENGMKGFRIVTEDWFNKARVMAGLWFADNKNKDFSGCVPIVAKFNKDLGYGDSGPEVKLLQSVLRDNYGIFKMEPTGNYFGYTTQCVKELQRLLKVEPASGYFGPLTRKALNKELNK